MTQYYDIYNSDHKDDKIIKYKNYLHRGPCIPCGKMDHTENPDQSLNHFWSHP